MVLPRAIYLLMWYPFNKVQTITSEFSHLKMLGHVFVVEDAKDLAQIVRDVTRYGGAYRPEVSPKTH